jgi:hypothetical protein
MWAIFEDPNNTPYLLAFRGCSDRKGISGEEGFCNIRSPEKS